MTPIIFLDIDGVLLPGKAWLLPVNTAVREMCRLPHHSPADAAERVTFDGCAVALVNRLCARTGAKLVIHSTWRRTVGDEATIAKLIGQGVDPAHLHADSTAPIRGVMPDKLHDIRLWLSDHQSTLIADHPILVVDDDVVALASELPQLRTDFADGLTVAMYRIALTYFAAADIEFGVHPVSPEDMARVVEAFDGDRIAAAIWLQTDTEFGYAHAKELNVERLRKMAESYPQIRDIDAWVTARRDVIWSALAERTRQPDDDLDDHPSVVAP